QRDSGMKDAALCGVASVGGRPVSLTIMDFFFMGGSMGSVVGEKVARSIEAAISERRALIVVSATGGARMQEGILSLMQMAKTSALLARLQDERLPFISILTDPSTAGVLASYASLGHVILAEPGALVGFAGARERSSGSVSARLQGALEALYGLERHKSGLGLDGSRRLLEALGSPERRFRAVHVAGTNGKGSVCALVERVLRAAGRSTGLFTSPHLVDFRERIRIRGRWASEDELEARLEHIQGLPEGRGRTFFEVTTALGFDRFAAHA